MLSWTPREHELRLERRRQRKRRAKARWCRKRKIRNLRTAKRNRDEGYTEPEQGSEA